MQTILTTLICPEMLFPLLHYFNTPVLLWVKLGSPLGRTKVGPSGPGFFTLMRAAVLHTISDMRVEEVDAPRLGTADILLQVVYCGVCGSDIPRINKGAAHYYPITLDDSIDIIMLRARAKTGSN